MPSLENTLDRQVVRQGKVGFHHAETQFGKFRISLDSLDLSLGFT